MDVDLNELQELSLLMFDEGFLKFLAYWRMGLLNYFPFVIP